MSNDQFVIHIGRNETAKFARGAGSAESQFDGLEEFARKRIQETKSRLRVHKPLHDWASHRLHDEAMKLQFSTPGRDYMDSVREAYRRAPDLLRLVTGEIWADDDADVVLREMGR